MDTLLYETRRPIALIRLNRPRRRNAMNLRMVEELGACLNKAIGDGDIRTVILLGDDVAFCAGQDLKEPEHPDFIAMLNALLFAIEDAPIPVIAAIGGWCIAGGLELALACDLRVASENAKIGDWHAKINSLGGAGAIARLQKLVGIAAAKELVFTGDAIGADRALALGLVNAVHPAEKYEEAALSLAYRIAEIDPLTIRHAKATLKLVCELPLRPAVELTLANQRRLVSELAVDLVADYANRRK